MNRVKMLRLSTELLADFFREPDGKYFITSQGFPQDGRILDARVDHFDQHILLLLVESGSFDEVPHGNRIPELEVTFARTNRSSQANA